MRVYHNPVCSKSRGALEILGERGVDVEVIEYLKERAEPRRPRAHPRRDPRRAGGARAQGQALRASSGSTPPTTRPHDEVVALLLEHPELMERPVVFRGDRAVICRPSERVLELLD